MYVREMAVTHPNLGKGVNNALIHCVEQCVSCAQTCTACADACLAEDAADDLVECIRLNLDCADLCHAAGQIATRRAGDHDGALAVALQACAEACAMCAGMCELYAHRMEHCRICALHCQTCEEACLEALDRLEPTFPVRRIAN